MKPEVLILSPLVPLLTQGGASVRLCRMVEALSDVFTVRMVIVQDRKIDVPNTGIVSGMASCHRMYWKAPSKKESFLRFFNRLVTGNPFNFSRETKCEFVNHLRNRYSPNVLIVVRSMMGALFGETNLSRYFQGVPVILEEGALHYLSYQREVPCAANFRDKLIAYIRYKRLYWFSRRMVKHFTMATVVSRDEQRLLKSYAKADMISLVPNGVDEKDPIRAGNSHLVLMGPFYYEPNRHALEWFMRKVYPLLSLARDNKIYIVGANPPEYLKNLAETDKKIVVTGHITGLEEIYHLADVVLCPMWKGAGTRTKVLEAMNFGKAVITTTIGAEGIDVNNNDDIVIRDTAEGFADGIGDLLNDQGKAARIGQQARACVQRQYLWRSIMKNFCQQVLEISRK